MSLSENPNTTTVMSASCAVATGQPMRWRLPATPVFVGEVVAFIALMFAAGAPSPLFVLYQREWGFPTWLLTVAFAIYAFTLLATLLVAGSLSDYIGRRPVLIAALVIEAIGMSLFVFAPNIGWIIAARAIQGVATGAATSAFTAVIVELAPERYRRLSALIVSAAPMGGLALGAFITGFAIQFTVAPSAIIFSALTLVFLLGAAITVLAAETVARRAGVARSFIPRVVVPRAARREFMASALTQIAAWMLAGLFLGLAPSIIRGVFRLDSGLVNGVMVGLAPTAGTVASLLLGRVSARLTQMAGAVASLVGVVVFVAGVIGGWFPLLVIGVVIGGAGFGASFSGALRTLAPLVTGTERAGLFAAVYLVCYLAYGAPALVAGELIGVIGLQRAVIGYAVVVSIFAAVGLLAQSRLARSR